MTATTAGTPAAAAKSACHALRDEIEAYLASPPRRDRFVSPVIDWHHPDEYSQQGVQGLSKFLTQVIKECHILDELAASARSSDHEFSSNFIALQGVWEAFRRATPPLVGIWQVIDRRPGPGGGSGAGGTKVDVVARGGDEWIKVNTIKESRLLIEFREHDSYINSDYDSDTDTEESPAVGLTNSLLAQARALVEAAAVHPRLPGLPVPRVKYVLTRLEPTGHSDPRVGETLDAMRAMGIEIEFASTSTSTPDTTPDIPTPPPVPAEDIVLDLSVLIALCCDSTHYPLPKDDDELEARFRALEPDGSLAQLRGAARDLRDQLRCEIQRPLIAELLDRLQDTPRLWVTREVRERLPSLVDVIGGEAERARARALFDGGNFWHESRWEGKTGCLTDIKVRILEDDPDAPSIRDGEATPFDSLLAHVCQSMLDTIAESPPTPPEPAIRPRKKDQAPKPKLPPETKTKKGKASNSPRRPGTVFPPPGRLPSGHTLRTLLAGIGRHATVLTNNRGAVLKVLREAGVSDGIPAGGGEEARIWVVNPSSLAEWRRLEVLESNARLAQGQEERDRQVNGSALGGL